MADRSNRPRMRRGNRQPSRGDSPVILYFDGQRVEGKVLDESPSGLGILVPFDTKLDEKQRIRLLFKGRNLAGRVAHLVADEDGMRLGLRLEGK